MFGIILWKFVVNNNKNCFIIINGKRMGFRRYTYVTKLQAKIKNC